jgi:hypothetical protein
MFELVKGKYFVKKELLLSSFTAVMQLMEGSAPWIAN